MDNKGDSNIPWPVWAFVTIVVALIGAYAIINSNKSKTEVSTVNAPPTFTPTKDPEILPDTLSTSRSGETPGVRAERLDENQVEVIQAPSKPQSVYNPSAYVPQDIQSMWVFLQNPNNTSKEGCTRLADPIKPDAFSQRIGEFINEAKTRNEKLIVTAVTTQGDWDGATRKITIGGKQLNPMQSYYCNAGEENYGYGVQW